MSNFQFKIEDRSTIFDEKDVWADDKLGFCDDAARRLNGIVSGQELPLTICLNGTWGSGKTFFLTRFVENYNKRKPEGRAVYFNAWQDDFLDDPLLAIIGQLKNVIKEGSDTELYESIKSAALPCLTKIGLSISKQVAKKVTGIDIDTIDVDDLRSDAEKLFKQYHEMDVSRKNLRKAIEKLTDETWKATGKPLLFVVDELDRCRPTFAIEVLERIKHLFNVPHLVFLIGADLGQLGKSIKAVYGDIDSADYLHRFLDIEVKLPVADKLQYVYALWEQYCLDSVLPSHGVHLNSQQCSISEFRQLIKFRDVTLRQIEKCVRTYALLAMSRNNAACQWALLAAIAVVLKVTDIDSYQKFIKMEFGLGELINELYPGATYKDIDDESGIYNMVQHLSKIAYFRSENSIVHERFDVVKMAISENKGIVYDSEIMPRCFAESSAEQIASFYTYVFNENPRTTYAFRGVSAVLQQMDKGLQFIV